MANAAATPESVAVWFEIPASNFDRAVSFYQSVFKTQLIQEEIGPNRLAVFPYNRDKGISGCVMAGEGHIPNPNGTMIYLNAERDLGEALGRIKDAGGEILLDKTALPPGMGYFAHFRDSEGNRIGLHSIG
jgi:uncharacterized protein